MKIPEPIKLARGDYYIRMRLNGASVMVHGNTKTECRHNAELLKAEHRTKKRIISRSDMTVADAVDRYIEKQLAGKFISERSAAEYRQIRKNRFQSIMDINIGNIRNEDLANAVNRELAQPSRKGGTVSVKTVKSAYSLIASAIRTVNRDLNTEVRFPEVQRKIPQLLTPEAIYSAIKGTDIELPCLLAMWLSLSMSEIRGLTKAKSLKDGKMYILETVVDIDGKPVRKPGAKEENRVRCLEVPDHIQQLIDAVDGDIIEPRSGHAVYMRFKKVLEQSGLPPMRFHDLRHVFASKAAELEIPGNIIQDIGGWKTDETMKRVYTHSFDKSRKEADQKIADYFNSVIKNANENVNESGKV